MLNHPFARNLARARGREELILCNRRVVAGNPVLAALAARTGALACERLTYIKVGRLAKLNLSISAVQCEKSGT